MYLVFTVGEYVLDNCIFVENETRTFINFIYCSFQHSKLFKEWFWHVISGCNFTLLCCQRHLKTCDVSIYYVTRFPRLFPMELCHKNSIPTDKLKFPHSMLNTKCLQIKTVDNNQHHFCRAQYRHNGGFEVHSRHTLHYKANRIFIHLDMCTTVLCSVNACCNRLRENIRRLLVLWSNITRGVSKERAALL